ncbi:MAG: hypothetical protein Q3976_07245 [Corynebacterium sp.]|nr:hypothetical protein [Corynebacterium sp.]
MDYIYAFGPTILLLIIILGAIIYTVTKATRYFRDLSTTLHSIQSELAALNSAGLSAKQSRTANSSEN